MIATLNSDCSILTLSSTALTEASNKTFDSLVLKSRLNCSSTESSVIVSSLIGSITDNKISIPATQFYADATKTKYCDGVYYFQLDTIYTFDTSGEEHAGTYLVEDSSCVAVTCALKCKLLEYYQSCKDQTAWYYYYALLQGNDCDSCACTEMCSLYNELKLILNDNNITTSESGCGCT